MDEAILASLRARPGAFVSGEELSRLAGVSRTAIWKGVEKLRLEGYKILAQPHTGYQLVAAPDRLIPQEIRWGLRTRRLGRRIHAYATTDSTMDVAHQLASAGEPEGTVVVAEGQRKGRGRMSRNWVSPKGKGIYLSLILRPPLKLTEVPQITLMAAVAVARAIHTTTGTKPQIKWPNDILMGNKKVAGILTELNAELNRLNHCVIGIGLNANGSSAHLPSHATSLSEVVGAKVDRVALVRTLLTQLEKSYLELLGSGLAPILEGWRTFANFLGSHVRVEVRGRTVDGQAVDLDESGALLVRTDTGFVEPISAGDVLVVR